MFDTKYRIIEFDDGHFEVQSKRSCLFSGRSTEGEFENYGSFTDRWNNYSFQSKTEAELYIDVQLRLNIVAKKKAKIINKTIYPK